MNNTQENKNRVDSYIESEEDQENGHADTRNQNFECHSPDPNLGCNLGIDVAG